MQEILRNVCKFVLKVKIIPMKANSDPEETENTTEGPVS